MNLGVVDWLFIGGAGVIILTPLLMGCFGFGAPQRHRPWLKKAVLTMATLQAIVLTYWVWIFAVNNTRHVNHLKWIAPLVFVVLLMWVCFGLGFAGAALRYFIKSKIRP